MASFEIGPRQRSGEHEARDPKIFSKVLACVDCSYASLAALSHAVAIAQAIGCELEVIRVIEATGLRASPTDPVDWAMQHRLAEAEVRANAAAFGELVHQVIIDDGVPGNRICDYVRENGVDLTVLSTGSTRNGTPTTPGSTALRVAEMAQGSVLLVPASHPSAHPVSYRRIMTLLDGSARAESALPVAVAVATAHHSNIVLVHAASDKVDPAGTRTVKPETQASSDRMSQRGERVGAHYLKRIQSWLPEGNGHHASHLLASDDPRHAVAKVASKDSADLIVLSSTGFGSHPGVTLGSVAEYLISHTEIPVLLVRDRASDMVSNAGRALDSSDLRQPLGAGL
ncbi:universal stress protein [Rhizobium alvei]|uniref:Universal stress protein n=1 Tax=Rhizobium alvei TaxID=1132659 RepID=A0ABT8YP55_9HYPH|nr:universal stress protein [Rhizobium alvei]MDO6965463.1 universal stress protein [Rhizobium alvei]